MDLCERKDSTEKRHPWELSRCKAVRSILEMIPVPEEGYRLLDVGCGDGFISYEMAKDRRIRNITGIDIHLSEEQAAEMGSTVEGVTFHNKFDDLKRNHCNLLLLLDVMEHVEQDGAYLCDIVWKYISPGGYMVITVPAYPFLFGSHDRFMKHFRRYTRKDLLEVIHSAGLECLSSGYLFFSLLPARVLATSFEKWFSPKVAGNRGVGSWNHGTILTKALEFLLNTDVRLEMLLNRAGFTLPGLTVWALCKKQR
ncbi:MAG: class I SAM-dependent methyltransferase [Candidatus Deferrimicrobiaceae bacterium]